MRGSASFLRSLRVNEKSYMSWCQMLSTVCADDLHRILHPRTTDLRCHCEGRGHTNAHAVLAHGSLDVNRYHVRFSLYSQHVLGYDLIHAHSLRYCHQ